jgi:hypothetical protein
MDLQQRKLKKSEWDSIEISVSQDEMDVLQMIIQGYHNVNVKINNHNSIFTFLKIEYSEKIEDYVFVRFLLERVSKIEKSLKTFETGYEPIKMDSSAKVNSADKIRLERFDENTLKKNNIYEFILLDHIELLLRGLEKSDK